MFGALLLFEDEFIHVVSISFTALILTELIMVALTIRTWHWLMIIAEFLSLAIYILSLIILKDFFGKYYTNWEESDTPDMCKSRKKCIIRQTFYRDWCKKIGLDQNLTNNKKSTIFELSSWNFVKMTSSWVGLFEQVSLW